MTSPPVKSRSLIRLQVDLFSVCKEDDSFQAKQFLCEQLHAVVESEIVCSYFFSSCGQFSEASSQNHLFANLNGTSNKHKRVKCLLISI